jgi:hypothetical protein
MARSCRECGFELVKGSVAMVEGVESGWRVQLLDYPVLKCPQGHDLREAFRDFNTYWSAFVASRKAEVWIKPRGIFKRELLCAKCERPVRPLDRVILKRVVDVPKHPGYAFTLVVDGPGLHCERCEHFWLDDRRASDVFEALAKALKSLAIRRF